MKKINKEDYNWYGFDHEAVTKKLEGALTYVGTFCILDNYKPVAVYYNSNPNREKDHKDYVLLWVEYSSEEEPAILVSGLDKEDMEEERYQDGIICSLCSELLYSVNRHDNRECSCGACAIDGGKNYTRITGDKDKRRLTTIDLLTGKEKIDQ